VADEALQIHGGYGYMEEYADLALLPRRQDPRDRRMGTNEIQRLVIARGLGC
jgi:alkylation response protein AidB-like acyl-CoA dehydrogenase